MYLTCYYIISNKRRCCCLTEFVNQSQETIDLYELRPVGNPDGKPYGQILSLDPLIGHAYFEAEDTKLVKKDDDDILVEVYVGSKDLSSNPCEEGQLLATITDDDGDAEYIVDTTSYPIGNYNELFRDVPGTASFPAFKNSHVGVAEFTISDYLDSDILFADRGAKQIYFPAPDSDKDGLLKVRKKLVVYLSFVRFPIDTV